MGLVPDVSPFHLRDLNFLGTVWLVVLFVVFCLVWVLCLLFGCLFGLLLPRMRSFTLLNCVRIVCNLERPSELSWRARHGRKKKVSNTSAHKHPQESPRSSTASDLFDTAAQTEEDPVPRSETAH